MDSDFLNQLTTVLAIVTGVLALLARLGLPSVLGYLVVGMIIGPEALGLLHTQREVGILSDVGIMLMMFMIGLDFSWPKLKRNLRMVVRVGAACTAAITALTMWLLSATGHFSAAAAFLIGGAVSMSSTAVVSKQLIDQKEFYESHGRIAFGITLFQDFAAVLFLASLPALAHADNSRAMLHDLAVNIGALLLVLFGIYFFGKKVELSLMRSIGALKSNEIFVFTTLLTIIGAAWASSLFQLPTLLGVFLAGMIIGETEFRHKVEDDLRPFHDIMIGIFFIVMGTLLKLSVLAAHFPLILLLVAAIFAVKLALTTLIVSVYSRSFGNGLRVGLVLSNCDEFSLILVVLGVKLGIIDPAFGNILLIAFVLSLMVSTLFILYNKPVAFFVLSLLKLKRGPEEDSSEDEALRHISHHIILCGFGETGKNIRNMLKGTHIPLLAIDTDPAQVEKALALGCQALYGDATSLKTLKSAQIERARALVITFDNYVHTLKLLHKVRSEYPRLPVIARVHRMDDIEDLRSWATAVFSDGIGTSAAMRTEIMDALKIPANLPGGDVYTVHKALNH
ncbi:MAG: cation:proton antiporter [Proteobacteria bacterium]|nr:cation:proton antiporter [Pseudomonadota bacterium]